MWAALPTDSTVHRPPPIKTPPLKISLDEYSRCSGCGAQPSGTLPTSWDACKIYTLQEAFTCEIERQICPTGCSGGRYRFIGPDCSKIGLFNYNNRLLFTHDLLNDYTLCYTTSETPFTAWVTVTQTRYDQFSPGATFVSEEIFRAAWFSFTPLQCFGLEMQCPVCGPEPPVVIFDGVTVAFGKKHLTGSLKPPTVPDEHSPVRTCRSVQGQAAITDKSLRGYIRKVVTGRSLLVSTQELGNGDHEEHSSSDVEEGESLAVPKKALKEVVERIDLIPAVSEALSKIDKSLGSLFHQYCGIQRLAEKRHSPRPMIQLFGEVSNFWFM